MAPRASSRKLERIDPHDTEGDLVRVRQRIQEGEAQIPKEVAQEVLAFADAQEGTVSKQRVLAYLRLLPLVCEKIGPTDLLSPTRETPAKIRVAYKGYAGWTIMSAGAITMKFWRWRLAKAGQEFPSYLSVRVSKKVCSHKDVSVVITPEEVARLVTTARNSRDKAIIATLYESGTRVGELLSLRVRDVERTDSGGFRLHVEGKTGRRTIPLFESSVPALASWLKDHPTARDGTSPLWIGLQGGERFGKPMNYPAVRRMIAEAGKRAGIDKELNPHAFRHSRASAIAKNGAISTSILESYFGWQHGSPMAATYVHLNGTEVEEAMARAIGVEKVETPKVSPRIPKTCPRCEHVNDAANEFCGRCASPLSGEAVGRLLKDEARASSLASLLKKPEVIEFLAKELAKSKA
jgi:integrase/recombinase XerD